MTQGGQGKSGSKSLPMSLFHPVDSSEGLFAENSLGWKQLTVTNSLVYNDTEIITTVKSFITQWPAL